jgi:hypothetical protein
VKTRTTLVAAGVLLTVYAVAGALADPDLTPGGVLIFLAGVLIGHDVVWMAVLLAAGAMITRLVPERRRPVARTAAITAAAVTFVALPLLFSAGHPYSRNLVVVLGVIAVVALLALSRKKSERPGRTGAGDPGR